MTRDGDELAFSFQWLAGAAETKDRPESLSVCEAGHLVVSERTHWQVQRISNDMRALFCKWVDHP